MEPLLITEYFLHGWVFKDLSNLLPVYNLSRSLWLKFYFEYEDWSVCKLYFKNSKLKQQSSFEATF